MTRASLLAAAALMALAGPALAQTSSTPDTSGPPPVVYVPPAPGTPIAQPQPVAPPQVIILQPQEQPRGNTRVGQLQCDVAGGVGWVFGSSRNLSCEFKPSNGPVERYVGEIRRFGIDIGVTGRSTILWTVVNTGTDIRPGSLAGNYAGASSNIAAGLGLGSAALIGGSGDQVALQPLAIETGTGVNVAAGVAELILRSAG